MAIHPHGEFPMEHHEAAARLEALREEYLKRIEAINRDVRGGLSADAGEQVVELENAEVLDALAREAREQLSRVERALERLETGTYGLCAGCGEPIESARLNHQPAAVRCRDCMERHEAAHA